jgi:hypothetical protein
MIGATSPQNLIDARLKQVLSHVYACGLEGKFELPMLDFWRSGCVSECWVGKKGLPVLAGKKIQPRFWIGTLHGVPAVRRSHRVLERMRLLSYVLRLSA